MSPYGYIGTIKKKVFVTENYVNGQWAQVSEEVLEWITLNVQNGYTQTYNITDVREFYDGTTEKLIYRTFYRTYIYKTY